MNSVWEVYSPSVYPWGVRRQYIPLYSFVGSIFPLQFTYRAFMGSMSPLFSLPRAIVVSAYHAEIYFKISKLTAKALNASAAVLKT